MSPVQASAASGKKSGAEGGQASAASERETSAASEREASAASEREASAASEREAGAGSNETAAAGSAHANLRGIVAMSICCALFLLGDLLLKLTSAALPMGEIIFLRGLSIIAIVPVLLWLSGELRALRRLTGFWALLRTGGELGSTVSYLPALFHLPIGNATVLLQTAPLALTASAAVFLREPVGWRRWTAIVVGLVGVLIVVRPGLGGFNAYSLLVGLTVASICLRDIATRRLPQGIPGMALILPFGIGSVPLGLALGLFEHWVWPPPLALAALAGATSALLVGYYFIVVATRSGDVSVVSIFRYTSIPYAILAGYLVWGDIPDWPMLLGTAIILGAGLYVANRERIRMRELRRAP